MPRWLLLAALPVVLIAGLVALFLAYRPLDYLSRGAPPVENLVVERTRLDETGISLWVRNDGATENRIAQIQVDAAYWTFEQDPPGPIPRLGSARIDLAYPWVEGETHHLVLLTPSGAAFEHSIEVAVTTPELDREGLAGFALVGLFVGVVPVALGMLFMPAVRRLGPGALDAALALTIGLLAFLLVDTLGEGLELGAAAAGAFQGQAVVWLAAVATFLALIALGRRGGRAPEGAALAGYIALGIGLHNLGEGLAIGAAFATGEAALASFLVLGFALHNVTEGIGIAAPLTDRPARLRTFVLLALLAGLPAVVGAIVGARAFAPQWAALCFGIGAGAILQVIVEVGLYLRRRAGERWLGGPSLAGFLAGLAIMWATGLLTTA